MPIRQIDVSLKEYFLDEGFQYGEDKFSLGMEHILFAEDVLRKYFKPLGYTVERPSTAAPTWQETGCAEYNKIRLILSKKEQVIIDMGDIKGGSKEFYAFIEAEEEFQARVETDYERVMKTKLNELPLILGEINSNEGKNCLEHRFKDPMFGVRQIANESNSIPEFLDKIKKCVEVWKGV